MGKSIRRLAADLYGGGMESAGAETEFWAALPALPIPALAALVRAAVPGARFEIMAAAVQNATAERMAAIKTEFDGAELAAMKAAR